MKLKICASIILLTGVLLGMQSISANNAFVAPQEQSAPMPQKNFLQRGGQWVWDNKGKLAIGAIVLGLAYYCGTESVANTPSPAALAIVPFTPAPIPIFNQAAPIVIRPMAFLHETDLSVTRYLSICVSCLAGNSLISTGHNPTPANTIFLTEAVCRFLLTIPQGQLRQGYCRWLIANRMHQRLPLFSPIAMPSLPQAAPAA